MNSDAPAAPPDAKKSTTNDFLLYYRKKSILGLHLLGALIAFFAPVDILSQLPAAKAFVDAVNSVVPLPANFAKRSTFPQLLEFYGAVMLVSLPWWVWSWFRGPQYELQVRRMRGRVEERVSLQLLMVLVVVAAPFGTYMYLLIVTPTDLHLAPFQSERWALAVFGPVFYCWAPMAPLIFAISSIDVLRRIWGGK